MRVTRRRGEERRVTDKIGMNENGRGSSGYKLIENDIKGRKKDIMGTKTTVIRDETIGLLDLVYYVNIKINISTLRCITLPNLLDLLSELLPQDFSSQEPTTVSMQLQLLTCLRPVWEKKYNNGLGRDYDQKRKYFLLTFPHMYIAYLHV